MHATRCSKIYIRIYKQYINSYTFPAGDGGGQTKQNEINENKLKLNFNVPKTRRRHKAIHQIQKATVSIVLAYNKHNLVIFRIITKNVGHNIFKRLSHLKRKAPDSSFALVRDGQCSLSH